MEHPLLATDVAILPPPDVGARAVELSAGLPQQDDGLRLGPDQLPHVTLVQQFIREDELPLACARIEEVLRGRPAFEVRVTGVERVGGTIWMAIERTPELTALHEALMEALRGVERPGGTTAAFYDGNARMADIWWVASYRLKSSFGAFTPHITLGHGSEPPRLDPFTFHAGTIALCHLGRFCTCRRVLRQWSLHARSA
jgi:2'-5' RNA ligase